MVDSYGPEWTSKPREIDGVPTQLGRDQAAIMGMLWHATHTNWFEYKAGSRVYHLRFPLRYQKLALARDGVPVYFETPGPLTRERQPPIPDPSERLKV